MIPASAFVPSSPQPWLVEGLGAPAPRDRDATATVVRALTIGASLSIAAVLLYQVRRDARRGRR
jgi:hypothetical protein